MLEIILDSPWDLSEVILARDFDMIFQGHRPKML